MKILALTTSAVASAFLLTGCVTGNNKMQMEYDRGQSDAVKELYWAKERAKQTDAHSAPDPWTTSKSRSSKTRTLPSNRCRTPPCCPSSPRNPTNHL